MTRRRRIFDIDLPMDAPDPAQAPIDRERRGPMAIALRGMAHTQTLLTASSLRAR
jgi:hypothetical protein